MKLNCNHLTVKVIVFAALIQFLHSLEFMMMVPISSDLVTSMHFNKAYTGYITGIYVIASSLSSLFFSSVLDKFDRKKGILISLIGMSLMTYFTTLSWSFSSVIIFRTLAGLFAGPLISLSMSMILDYVSNNKKTFAFAIVTSMLSVSSIVGVPISLILSAHAGWHLPMTVLAIMGAIIAVLITIVLPEMKKHLGKKKPPQSSNMLSNPIFLKSFILTGLSIFATFLIVPQIALYIQLNLGMSRDNLSFYYLIAGVYSFIIINICGKINDKKGFVFVITLTSFALAFIILRAFIFVSAEPAVIALFAGFMAFSMGRTVVSVLSSTAYTKPWERANYMSLQNASQGIFTGVASFVSSSIIYVNNGKLHNMNVVALMSLSAFIIVPLLSLSLRRSQNAYQEK
ncbi:MFS transporter [Photorhabdus heterorhabditis]|uniref:MFS transporter n=1 Tax=Photorhabdus heterorhabditis TaxID=880156 RepID=UPI0015628185|nr:MFS transporter [Photorhabdus heterorhabditis]NRN29412.1 MFS transporter [Photorhabdus heterorhabditis subsp. aluminescens]